MKTIIIITALAFICSCSTQNKKSRSLASMGTEINYSDNISLALINTIENQAYTLNPNLVSKLEISSDINIGAIIQNQSLLSYYSQIDKNQPYCLVNITPMQYKYVMTDGKHSKVQIFQYKNSNFIETNKDKETTLKNGYTDTISSIRFLHTITDFRAHNTKSISIYFESKDSEQPIIRNISCLYSNSYSPEDLKFTIGLFKSIVGKYVNIYLAEANK